MRNEQFTHVFTELRVPKTIYWINGAFGVGKTSVAKRLLQTLGNAVLLDPEEVGFLVRRIVSKPTPDFQDMPLWRQLVIETAAALAEYENASLVVPMTLLHREYRSEIFGGLRDRGFRLRHFVLDASPTTLQERIAAHTMFPDDLARSQSVVMWRMAHVANYLASVPELAIEATIVETDGLTVDAVAAKLAELIRGHATKQPS